MRKAGKLISATVVVSTLVVGSSAAYISTSSPTAQAAEQVQKWGHGEGSASGANSENGVRTQAQTTPWYNYEGYTTYDPSFTQDYNFVRALKYDNVTIDGYKVDTDAKKEFDHSKKVYDTNVEINIDNELMQLTFFKKHYSLSKATFKKAHTSNEIIEDGKLGNGDGTYVKYATNNGFYTA